MDNLEVVEVATKGRGLIAKKSFQTGQLVLREDAYAYVVMSNYAQSVCHYCLSSSKMVSHAD